MIATFLALVYLSDRDPIPPSPGFKVVTKLAKYDVRRDPFWECLVLKESDKIVFVESKKYLKKISALEKEADRISIKDYNLDVSFSKRSLLKVEDGWLTSIDFGEYGGGIYWLSPDYKRRARIYDSNARLEVSMKQGIFCLAGNHYGRPGALLRLDKSQKGWQATEVATLPEIPSFAKKWNDNELIFGDRNVWSVDTSGRVNKLFSIPIELAIPNSIEINNGIAYIAGQYRVAAISLRDGRVRRWYQPSSVPNN